MSSKFPLKFKSESDGDLPTFRKSKKESFQRRANSQKFTMDLETSDSLIEKVDLEGGENREEVTYVLLCYLT